MRCSCEHTEREGTSLYGCASCESSVVFPSLHVDDFPSWQGTPLAVRLAPALCSHP